MDGEASHRGRDPFPRQVRLNILHTEVLGATYLRELGTCCPRPAGALSLSNRDRPSD